MASGRHAHRAAHGPEGGGPTSRPVPHDERLLGHRITAVASGAETVDREEHALARARHDVTAACDNQAGPRGAGADPLLLGGAGARDEPSAGRERPRRRRAVVLHASALLE